jgi:uroporphyrinogen-III synthase
MRVIVTRPDGDAQRWVRDLLALGHDAVALPLIQIGANDDVQAVAQAWQTLGNYVGAMFVSGNAVQHFFALKPPLALDFTKESALKIRAWATGPGTAQALLRAGVDPARLDAPDPESAQFDSENLWQRVSHQVHAGNRVLIVRGGDGATGGYASSGLGREWFSNRVGSVGGIVDFVVSYQRSSPAFTAHELALARDSAVDGSVWLMSSTEAVANLKAWLPGQSWRGARALATHPRIATAAQEAGFGVVQESRPTLRDVVASIESMA